MTDIKHRSFHLILTDTEYINSVILEDTYVLFRISNRIHIVPSKYTSPNLMTANEEK